MPVIPDGEQDAIVVSASPPLRGRVHIGGAKNAVLKEIAATLSAPGTYRLTNVPKITDIINMLRLVGHLGADFEILPGEVTDEVVITVHDTLHTTAPDHLWTAIRATLQCAAPVLARAGQVSFVMPGGDQIGARGIGIHLAGLRAMGVEVTHDGATYTLRAPDGLHGAVFALEFPSVGATETLVLAGVRAKGQTILTRAAKEPEIVDLCDMLNAMGANIAGHGTNEIVIQGVEALHPLSAPHEVIGDRIEAGTYIAAAIVTKGDVLIEGINPAHLAGPLALLAQANVDIEADHEAHTIHVRPSDEIHAMEITTNVYPGFPTDLQAPFLVVCSQSQGECHILENIFEDRLGVIPQLQSLGMNCLLFPGADETTHSSAVTFPDSQLRGGHVLVNDIRAGAALVIAGLIGSEPTVVFAPHHIDRGYANFVPTLQRLGANIERTTRPVPEPASAS